MSFSRMAVLVRTVHQLGLKLAPMVLNLLGEEKNAVHDLKIIKTGLPFSLIGAFKGF